MLTSPPSVNFTALPIKFIKIWRSRPESPTSAVGRFAGTKQVSSRPLLYAESAKASVTSSTTVRKSNPLCSSSILPASILERSRIWLITPRSVPAERRAVSTKRCCVGPRSVWRTSSSIPRTPFNGVRISWLILARNCDFDPDRALKLDGPLSNSRFQSYIQLTQLLLGPALRSVPGRKCVRHLIEGRS